MLCCLWQDPSSVGNDLSNNNSGVSLFPGQRRSLSQPNGNGNACASASTPAPTAPLMMNVVVPPGMAPGQTVQVVAPDGSRTVNAIIPQGLESGMTFFVTFPADSTSGNNQSQNNHTATGSSNLHSSGGNAQTVSPSPVKGPMSSSAAAPVMPPVTSTNQSTIPFSQVLDGPPPNMSSQAPFSNMHPNSNHNNNNNNDQKLLLVNVPPGSEPGSTLYVSVPGENRTLAAKVPHGVSQFHVAYQPRTATTTSATPPIPVPAPAPGPSIINPLPTSNNNGQKLILVRVPPGTTPGTTLHVPVPDEPGRVLAAEVPPNTSEFQVAYIPRSLQQQQQNQSQSQQFYGQSHYNSHPGRMMNQGGGMGMGRMSNGMLPFFGGAALGAAGVGMYDHYHHHGGYQDYNDYGDAGGYDDYGGADFGGDFSGGDF